MAQSKIEKIVSIVMPSNKIASLFFMRDADKVGVYDGDKLLAVRTKIDAEKAVEYSLKNNQHVETVHCYN